MHPLISFLIILSFLTTFSGIFHLNLFFDSLRAASRATGFDIFSAALPKPIFISSNPLFIATRTKGFVHSSNL